MKTTNKFREKPTHTHLWIARLIELIHDSEKKISSLYGSSVKDETLSMQ